MLVTDEVGWEGGSNIDGSKTIPGISQKLLELPTTDQLNNLNVSVKACDTYN